MEELKKTYNEWSLARNRIFMMVAALALFAVIFLFASIVSNIYSVHNEPMQKRMNIDSLCRVINTEVYKSHGKSDSMAVSKMAQRIDSISLALTTLQHAVSDIEEQTSIRQDDIRQETNNIINKFNGYISWWLFLLGIICGFAPLMLAYLNHKNDSEYIKLLNSSYDNTLARLKEKEVDWDKKLDELKELDINLKNNEEERNFNLKSKIEEIKLMHTYMYITSFTRKSKFQSSVNRYSLSQKLLKELVANSLSCLNKYSKDKAEIKLIYWVVASIEGLELLMPYQKDQKCRRIMNRISIKLKKVQTEIFDGTVMLETKTINELMTELQNFNNIFIV